MATNLRQGCKKSFAILDDQMQSFLVSGRVAIADRHSLWCRPGADNLNLENRIARHNMIPAKKLGDERQIEWKMRPHIEPILVDHNPEDSRGLG